MRSLIRDSEPDCLARMRKSYASWYDVTKEDKAEIWVSLDKMQQEFCAFCEKNMRGQNKHIEHFIARSRNNKLTFIWSNLFGSCNSVDHCGRYKDNKVSNYDENFLIKPDSCNSVYFNFLNDGTILPKQNLSPEDTTKATETIRVFGLDSSVLNSSRRTILVGYEQIAKEYNELIKEIIAIGEPGSESFIEETITEYNKYIESQPFYTALSQLVF